MLFYVLLLGYDQRCYDDLYLGEPVTIINILENCENL